MSPPVQIFNTSVRFNKVILRLVFSHSFFVITLFGNLIILGFSVAFYAVESAINPTVKSLLDAIWWGFSTATTVGYGDIIPVTTSGKILGILLMLMGTALFATYTALFAQTILEDEFLRFKTQKQEKNTLLAELKKHRRFIDQQIRHYESATQNEEKQRRE